MPSYYGSHANNTTKGSRSGSIIFGKNPTCQPTINLLRFIVRQVPCRSGVYLKHEANVKTLLLDIKTMVSKLTVPSAAPIHLSRCANPNHLKTGRSESNLRLCGECSQISSKILFPDCANFRLRCDTIDDSGGSTQRHDDKDKCAK